MVLLQEQTRQQHLCPLPVTQSRKGPIKNLLLYIQQRQLFLQQPQLVIRDNVLNDIKSISRFILDTIGEVVKTDGCGNGPAVLVFPHKKVEECRLSPAIAPDKAQFPIGIYLKGDIFKDIPEAIIVTKG